MFKNDYILRMVEELTQALVRILQLRKSGAHQEAADAVDELARTMTGLNVETLALMPIAAILDMLKSRGDAVAERGAILARLLKERGDLLRSSDPEKSRSYHKKAFCLYDELAKQWGDEALSAHQEAIDSLVRELAAERVAAAIACEGASWEFPPELTAREDGRW